jgi:DNA-binding transcriptional MerR regulator
LTNAPTAESEAAPLRQIGEIAERTGLSLRTVRYYEEVGLLTVAQRSPGGFRLYTDEAVQRLLVIKQMKPLDFTLDQMRELLDALEELTSQAGQARKREIRSLLADYQRLVGERIAKMRERLLGAKALQDSLDDALLPDEPVTCHGLRA